MGGNIYRKCFLYHVCVTLIDAISLEIDVTAMRGKHLPRFWTSTGFSPTPSCGSIADFLISKDVKMNLAIISSVANRGITHVRIHWLLDIIRASCQANEPWKYNFDYMDQFLTQLRSWHLSPGFELMGNPSGCFTKNWTLHASEWEHFLQQLIHRYIDRFGIDYIREWRFETFNEPDLKMYNFWNMSLPEYLYYVNSSSAVLSRFNMELWGPAGLFKNKDYHRLCWGLLQHCASKNCPIRVLSFHKKGDGRASLVVKRGQQLIEKLKKKFPSLRNMSVANDEADPQTGWIKPLEWRKDTRYAAAIAQVVIGYFYVSIKDKSFGLKAISNDNGFVSFWPNFWTQRSLLARFQINNTSPPHIQMFRKPALSLMGLMSLLGKEVTSVVYEPGNPGISYLATAEENRKTLLLSINHDTLLNEVWKFEETKLKLRLTLPMSGERARGGIYLLDNIATNPAQEWYNAGQPNFPNKQLRRRIRQKENAAFKEIATGRNQTFLELESHLSIPSVMLINMCYEEVAEPGPVQELYYMEVTFNEILLIWNDDLINSKCIKTFIVEFYPNEGKIYKIITNTTYLTTSYHFDGCAPLKEEKCEELGVAGSYRVAAIDYWDRVGPYSNILHVPHNNS